MTPEQIIETIRREPKIPAPSQVVYQVLTLTRDPDCDMHRVSAVIGRDAGLTSQLLRQANSVLYGGETRTSSVAAACVRLGMKRVRSAVVNQHVVTGLARTCPPGFDARRYWQGALAASVAAGDLARVVLPASAEEAGTAGLLCDIGFGLLAFGIPERYRPVLAEYSAHPDRPLDQIENRLIGVTHGRVGAEVLADWGLEGGILEAVRGHHWDPAQGGAAPPALLVRVVAAGITLAQIALDGSEMERVDRLFAQVGTFAKDTDALVGRLLDDLAGNIQETARSLNVRIGPTEAMEANFAELLKELPPAPEGSPGPGAQLRRG
jgi:HD-like signal output (HDOD) protein